MFTGIKGSHKYHTLAFNIGPNRKLNGRGRAPSYYAPILTRWPTMTLIIIALLGCIAVLEYGLRSGISLTEKSQQQNRLLRRQTASTALASTSIVTTTVNSDTSTNTIPEASVQSATASAEAQSPTAVASMATTPTTTSPDSATITTTATTTDYLVQSTTPAVGTASTAQSTSYVVKSSTTTVGISSTAQSTSYVVKSSTTTVDISSSAQPTSYVVKSSPTTVGISSTAQPTSYVVKSSTTSVDISSTAQPTSYIMKSSTTTVGISSTAQPTSYVVKSSTTSVDISSTAQPTSYIMKSSTTSVGITATAQPTSYIVKSSTTSVGITATAQPTSYIVKSSTTSVGITATAQPSSYIVKSSTTGVSIVKSTTTTAVTADSTADPSAFVVQSSTTTTRTIPPVTTTSAVYVLQYSSTTNWPGSTTPAKIDSSTIPGAYVSQSAASSTTSLFATANGDRTITATTSTDSTGGDKSSDPLRQTAGSMVNPSGGTSDTSSTNSFSVVISTQTFTDTTGGVTIAAVSWTSYYPASSTTMVADQSGSSVPLPSTPPDEQRSYEVELGMALTDLQYFRAMYLPLFVAVLLKLTWNAVFAATKLMEPFYLLRREGGASAKDALMSDYLSSSLSITSLKTLFVGHPVVLLATLAYLFINILPALATQSTTVRAVAWCTSGTTALRCNPMWYLNIPVARILQGLLAATAVIILLMMILSARRESGIFSNPSSIATMASLLSNDDLICNLQSIPQGASRSLLRRHLDSHNYTLARYQTKSNQIRYGVVNAISTSFNTRSTSYGQQRYSAVPNPSRDMPSLSPPRSTFSNKFLLDTIFLLSILALLTVLVAYYLTGGDNPFNNFFNNHKESRFVLTLIASILDGHWKQLEREVRVLTPYRRLFRGAASPESTVLVAHNGTPITCFVPTLWRGNFFHAFVAFVATLSDVLIITIAGVPYSSAQTWMDFLVSIYSSWAILSIMAITVLAIFRWRALNEKMMIPREPSTLIAVWLLLCNENNGLREATEGFETSTSRERDENIKMSGSLYWGGWLTQPQGGQRWCVEREDK